MTPRTGGHLGCGARLPTIQSLRAALTICYGRRVAPAPSRVTIARLGRACGRRSARGRLRDSRLRRRAAPLLVTGALALRADLGVGVDALGVRGHAQAVLVADLDADVAAYAGQVLDRPYAVFARN